MCGIFKFLGIMVLAACIVQACQMEKEMDYSCNFPDARIVVHAFLHENGVFAEVKKTLPPLSIENPDSIANAHVSLYEDGEFLFELLHTDTNYYETPFTFVPAKGKEYHIEIEAEGFPIATSAKQTLPEKVKIDSVFYRKYSGVKKSYVQFTDPAETGNAYFVNYRIFIVGQQHMGSKFVNYSHTTDDATFNNSTFTFERELYNTYYTDWENYPDTTFKADSARFYLYSLCNAFKLFLESQDSYEISAQLPDFEQPFRLFSNIKNGYGIFGAYNLDSCTVVFCKDSI